jgi:hypothetical protein
VKLSTPPLWAYLRTRSDRGPENLGLIDTEKAFTQASIEWREEAPDPPHNFGKIPVDLSHYANEPYVEKWPNNAMGALKKLQS